MDQCVHGAVAIGQSANSTNSHAVEFDEKAKRRINPRIAFCLHELCNGCGKCSRTFYCDTFMDRRGLELPPVMDSRNCTGCGLCVQTCPRGAIQLFDPKHVVALIGTGDCLTAWHHRLTAYEIPHLVYTENNIEDIYRNIVKEYKEKKQSTSSEIVSEDKKTSTICDDSPLEHELFEFRKENDAFFDKLSEDYTDERVWENKQKDNEKKDARSIFEKVASCPVLKKWLFLAWSDPGQVLKDSPVIYAINDENCVYFETSMKKPEQINKRELLLEKMERIFTEVNKRLNNLREVK